MLKYFLFLRFKGSQMINNLIINCLKLLSKLLLKFINIEEVLKYENNTEH